MLPCCRLLRNNVQQAQAVLGGALPPVNYFAEDVSSEQRDAVFAEFNSLAVLYGAPAATFVERQAYHQLAAGQTGGVNYFRFVVMRC